MTGTLILCGSPIGNLSDAPPRLGEALSTADIVYAEDTRRVAVLLDHLGVSVPTRSLFVGNEASRSKEIAERLSTGETVAVVTDAGTPGISDPGASAVRAAIGAGATITGVPGPSAVTLALALSGFDADRFVFEGFLPRKGRERRERIEALRTDRRTAVLFCSPRRIGADLSDLAAAGLGDRGVVVARELTKLHEELWRGTLAEAADHWSDGARGEVTVVVDGGEPDPASLDDAVARVKERVEGGSSFTDAVREVATETGLSRRVLYEAALQDSS